MLLHTNSVMLCHISILTTKISYLFLVLLNGAQQQQQQQVTLDPAEVRRTGDCIWAQQNSDVLVCNDQRRGVPQQPVVNAGGTRIGSAVGKYEK